MIISGFDELKDKINESYFGELSVSDFIETVDNLLEVAHKQIPDYENYFKHRELKKIREEGYPLSIFLQKTNLLIQSIKASVKDHINYDAEIILGEGSKKKYIECTYVKDGEFEKYQGLHLDKFGRAPINGTNTNELFEGISNNSEVFGEASCHSEYLNNLFEGIKNRILDKKSKNYPKETILLVAFEDDCREDTIKSIKSYFSRNLNTLKCEKFERLYFVATTSKKVLPIYE